MEFEASCSYGVVVKVEDTRFRIGRAKIGEIRCD
jgi:hypothetical protein